ncbi:type II secretion system protein N [Paraglaciecola polaris]|uniref:Type II secretion system protein N n=1 Tax=Paraglaciecola polaris LMG 21857 TaxID=1129793 RepID=K7AJB6_9ALTE|nr:type II secretion system protein N [Paraglaciecola polaris]GAC35300.1 general secretion pathway protein N [Paraglaciecola polaris LMG 21857]|tara:strand:+ start:999 stop:1742 length:744 start_codon:yes stop_codon:yes gene_type:complete
MKSVLKWGVVCLTIYVAFLIAKLPAAQVISRVQLPDEITVHGVSGTIWNGHATIVTVQGLPIHDVNWQLAFWPLLTGSASLDVNAGNIREMEDISIDGHVVISNGRLQGEGVQVFLPTSLVISSLPLPIPVNASGRFKIALQELDYTEHCQALTGQGLWLKAKVQGTQQDIELGNFEADLKCDNEEIVMTINEPNSFGLSAVAHIPSSLAFRINGRFKPDPALPTEVHQAAQFFGKKDTQGYYPVKF